MMTRKIKQFFVTEAEFVKLTVTEAWQFARSNDWRKTFKVAFRRKYWGWWILLIVIVVLSTLLSSKHDQIVGFIRPYAQKIRTAPASWLIPLFLLIVVSFPPLFGHEILILLVGLIWGLGIGFLIAAAGTFLGEIACYYAFKHGFRDRAARIESKSVTYACLAKLMRDGGLPMVVLVRFSAIPGHVTTAIQSTIGIGIWIYAAAAFITLPKQFSIVYIGVIFGKTGKNSSTLPGGSTPGDDQRAPDGSPVHATSQQKMISFVVFAVTTLTTVIAAYIIWRKIRGMRDQVAEDIRRKREAVEGGVAAGGDCQEVGRDLESGQGSGVGSAISGLGMRRREDEICNAEAGDDDDDDDDDDSKKGRKDIGNDSDARRRRSMGGIPNPKKFAFDFLRPGKSNPSDPHLSSTSVSSFGTSGSSVWKNPPAPGENGVYLLNSPSLPHLPYYSRNDEGDATPGLRRERSTERVVVEGQEVEAEAEGEAGRREGEGAGTGVGSEPPDYFSVLRRGSAAF